MRKSFQATRPRISGSDPDGADHVHDPQIIVPANVIAIAESFEKKEQSWFVTSQIPTDLTIQVHDMTFYVHKYPVLSRCSHMNRLDLHHPESNFGCDLKLDNFPGGSETFESVLRFCYGLPIDLTATNVAPLRCAAEFLEMTEDLEEGNLISRTEAFLTFVVLSSWRDSITVLKSCESLSPWAENLQIIRRCSDSIAYKASRDNNSTIADPPAIDDEQWWFDDISMLRIDHFVRIITAIRAKGTRPEIVGACIARYAEKWLPRIDGEFEGFKGYGCEKNELQLSILSGKRQEDGGYQNREQRLLIESLVSILPPEREAVSCGFLLWMLKMAMVYSVTSALVSEIEKRVGMVLEDATVSDLLIPNNGNGDGGNHRNCSSGGERTLHDVDVVQRIVDYFLMQDPQQQKCGKMAVGKLIDNYLAEIARDPNLSVAKFQVLAEALPENARTCDDGLYRAIDTYLKTHPSLTEHERRRLCRAMDCEKLSLDACMHAAQNERLPLRTVVQVLFSEQVKMRAAFDGKDPLQGETTEQENNWSSTKREMKAIKAELDKLKGKMTELQRNYTQLQDEFEKLGKQKSGLGWSAGWKKIKNSTFFHGKISSGEKIEGIQNQTNLGCRAGGRRRMSIS